MFKKKNTHLWRLLRCREKTIEEFHRLPAKIYRNDANYTPLLRIMIENMFNPESNAKFREGDAERWIVKKGRECVGRIAAFMMQDILQAMSSLQDALVFLSA